MLTDTGSVSGRGYAPREEFLIAVTDTSVPAWPFGLPAETIGSRFDGRSPFHGLPELSHWPDSPLSGT